MAIALKGAIKGKYRLLAKRVSWPRKKGPTGVRLDVTTGYAVTFVR